MLTILPLIQWVMLLHIKKGSDSGKKIAVTVNMDEPGFIISGVTEKGLFEI